MKTRRCSLHRYRYDAKVAQRTADTRLSDSRTGVNCTQEEFRAIVDTVRPLLKQGLGLDAIWARHGKDLGISKRTLYRRCDKGYGLCNLDLPKKGHVPPAKKPRARSPKTDLSGRTYEDFSKHSFDARASAFEMDCLEGLKTDRRVILTLFHRHTHFHFGILLERHDSAHVSDALDLVEGICAGRFSDIFSVVLTDRGKEFL